MSDEFTGDLGGHSAPDEPLSHRRLEERAAREGWKVPQDVRIKVLKRLAAVVDPETLEGATAELRYVIQAARTIASADLRQQALDLRQQALDGGGSKDTLADAKVIDIVGTAEQRAIERLAERATDPAPG